MPTHRARLHALLPGHLLQSSMQPAGRRLGGVLQQLLHTHLFGRRPPRDSLLRSVAWFYSPSPTISSCAKSGFGLTKSLGAVILVSETTWTSCGEGFEGTRLAAEEIRGRKEPVVLFAVAGPPASA